MMVPRPEVVALSVEMPPEEALAAVLDSPYTRYPVYRESLDEIVGILHVRDLVLGPQRSRHRRRPAGRAARPAHIVPETKDLAALLAEFRRTNQHMAIVVDEYGAMEGIVTLEDLLEEIVGEIEDEFDLPDESVERSTRRRSGSTARSRSTTSTRSSGRRSSTRTTTRSRATSSTSSAGGPRPGRRGAVRRPAVHGARGRGLAGSSGSRWSSCPRPSRRGAGTQASGVAGVGSTARAGSPFCGIATSRSSWARCSHPSSGCR